MPCAFKLDHPLRDGKGCQFGVPENELIAFNDEMWCEFHCPLKAVKANWNETQIEVFNGKIFRFIDEANQDEKIADLSGVVFPGPVSFSRYADTSIDLPGVLFDGAMFNGDARFRGATFSDAAWFDGATFGGSAMFDGATFGDAWFDGATFGGGATFDGARFGGEAVFRKATFGGGAWFRKATFGGRAAFDGATFGGRAAFGGATFSDDAWFDGATFSDDAWFDGATFGGGAMFNGATFGDTAVFNGATFSGGTEFRKATFDGDTWFRQATFSGNADFSGSFDPPGDSFLRVTFADANFHGKARFTNRHFLESTDFSGGLFKIAPEFHNCTLHQDTNFDGRQFEDHSGEAVRAYRTLKLAMENVRSWDEQGRFFAYEQQSLRAHPNTPGWVRTFSWLYEQTADYGRSCMLPVRWFAGTFFFFCFYVYAPMWPGTLENVGDLVMFTVRQVIQPFHVLSPSYNDPMTRVLALLAALHSVFSFSFVALFILALRRRFKIG